MKVSQETSIKKVIIIGCPGAGKSTFARKLHKATGLPLYYLDMLWHKPDKTNYTREEFDRSLANILEQDEWIIDGNYIRTLEMRLACCDTVFLLDFPTELCIKSVENRIGTKREDMPWMENELDEEFRQWILDFPKPNCPKFIICSINTRKVCKLLFSKRERKRMIMQIKFIDKAHKVDINIKNEPFSLFGRMIPRLENGNWSYTTEEFDTLTEMTFPDENYDFDELSKNSTFIGAYDGDKCIGLAIMQEGFFKHMYLYDLKVNTAYRRQGVATMLMDYAMRLALDKGYIGIYTQGQDNNLAACKFYLKSGFVIGGFDNKVYDGTKQQGKADILFYKQIRGK